MKRILSLLLTVACLSTAARAQNHWPRFRGPNADGVASDDSGLPTTWTTTQNVQWATDVPGWGWSCPIVCADRVFLTSVVSDDENLTPSKGLYQGEGVREPAKGVHHWLVHCHDLNTGELLWRKEAHVGQPKVPRHPKSTYASETPTTDGERLYVLFGDLGLYCYDLDGKPLWSRKIEPQKTLFDYGAAASPVVHDGQVVVVYDNLQDSWIAAFDARTGDQRWREPRDETHSWATPFVWKNELRTEIVVPGKNRNRSYTLDGKLLWEFDGRMSSLVIPSPFAAHGLCYISSGYIGDAHRPTFAIRPGGSGEIAPDGDFENSEYIAWYQGTSSSYNPSQIVYGDYLYTLYDRGFLTCHNATTGEEIYGKQRFSPRGSFTASPFAFNGYLFFLSEDGLTYVVKAGPDFEIVERNDLDELCLASPAVAGDKLLIRTASKLYCLTEGAQLDAAAQARLQPRRGASPSMDIWAAAVDGNRDKVTRLLTAGVSVDARQPGSGSTPLCAIAIFGQTDMAKLLIEKGANVAIANQDGNTALHIASFFAHEEFVQLLLESGASVDVKNGRGETPLDLVAADWSPQLERIYGSIGELVGIELDLGRIKQTRPKIASLLREQAAKDATKDFSAQIAPAALARATSQLHAAVEAGEVAGEAHLVVMDGKTRHLEVAGVCDIEDQRAFEADTLLRIYSMTKPVTSVAAMTLCEQGKFQLDDPVSKFIPAFAETTVLEGEGGLVSTVRDYANFCQMLVDAGQFKGKRLLKPETIEPMFTDQLNGVAGDFHFGLGFAVAEVEIGSGENARKQSQYSWGGYASTDFRLVPEEKLFQIFVRQRVPSSNDLANRLFSIIHQGIETN